MHGREIERWIEKSCVTLMRNGADFTFRYNGWEFLITTFNMYEMSIDILAQLIKLLWTLPSNSEVIRVN